MTSSDLQTLSEWQFLLIEDIQEEYKKGLLALNSLPANTVTFYGGSRITKGSHSYTQTYDLAKAFAEHGWGVVSGGGPGIMSASLEGAKDGGGKAVAFRINIAQEPASTNSDVDILFEQFSVRKYMLRQSDILVYAPGGVGTLDELMENITLMSTNKHPKKPIFLLDSKFWQGYIDWIDEILVGQRRTVVGDVRELLCLVDSTEEVMQKLFPPK